MEAFSSCDSSEDEAPVLRVPREWRFRVINPGGVLFREECEIDGARVTLLARANAECVAYERRLSAQGVIRYRTNNGWISEHRRDREREVLVEVLDLLPTTEGDLKKEVSSGDATSNVAECFTLRETASLVISRSLMSLRALSIHLARSTCHDGTRTREQERLTGTNSSQLATTLSKYTKSYFSFASTYMTEPGVKPSCIGMYDIEVADDATSVPSATGPTSSSQLLGERRGGKGRSSSFEEFDRDLDDGKGRLPMSPATMCLYYGSIIKYIVMPILDDRNGNLNTFLFKYLHRHSNIIESVLEALVFVLACLQDAVSETIKADRADPSTHALSVCGRFALFSIHPVMAFVRKFAQASSFSKAVADSINIFAEDSGMYQLQDLVYDVICKISKVCLHIFRRRLVSTAEYPVLLFYSPTGICL